MDTNETHGQGIDFRCYLKRYPDKAGYFGRFGGAYVAKELDPAFKEITQAYHSICHSAQFINELRRIRSEFQGRPTPVYHYERLSRLNGGQLHSNPWAQNRGKDPRSLRVAAL